MVLLLWVSTCCTNGTAIYRLTLLAHGQVCRFAAPCACACACMHAADEVHLRLPVVALIHEV